MPTHLLHELADAVSL